MGGGYYVDGKGQGRPFVLSYLSVARRKTLRLDRGDGTYKPSALAMALQGHQRRFLFFSPQLFNPLLTLYIGTFFGGSQSSLEWFSRAFYAYHDHYLRNGLFVGIDQNIFNALFLLFPERFFTVCLNDPFAPAHQGITPSPGFITRLERGYLGECGAEWFYYQFWFADHATRERMKKIWMTGGRWRIWGWWQTRKYCRLTGALPMMDALRRSFGDSWQPPTKTVIIPP